MPNDKFERYCPSGDSNRAEREMHVSRYAYVADFINKNEDRRRQDGKKSKLRILDCGCGFGYGDAYLGRKTACSVVGIDKSTDAITFAKKHYSSELVSFREASVTDLPFGSKSFDFALSIGVLQQLKLGDAKTAISQMFRVLRPGGRAILLLPNRDVISKLYAKYGGNPYHKHEFNPAELAACLNEAGFSVTDCVGQQPRIPLIYRMFNSGLAPSGLFHPHKFLPVSSCVYFLMFAQKSSGMGKG